MTSDDFILSLLPTHDIVAIGYKKKENPLQKLLHNAKLVKSLPEQLLFWKG